MIRIDKKRIETYDFEEVENDVYQRGDITLVFEEHKCVEVSILNAIFKNIYDYRDLEKLIKMYEED